MKTKLFFFTMLISITASAQTGVTVTPVSTKNNAVTFNVSWLNSSRTGRHNSKVWVFIDYRPVTNNVPSGSWERALIAGMPTATSGTPTRETTTDKGFWLQGTSGSSGTYNATITATLSNVPAQFNWCAYVSDCPPNVSYNNGTYTLHGTPPFTLIAADGTTAQTVTGATITASELTITPVTMTDKTACPWGFCPYTGSDLFVDASHVCQLRTSGAKNWEAYIKDSRDNELYRIVLMPDNKWWLAQSVKYAGAGIVNSAANCTPDKCGRLYTGAQMSSTYTGSTGASGYGANKQGVCPNNWILPVYDDWRAFVDAIDVTSLVDITPVSCLFKQGRNILITQRLGAIDNPVLKGNNYYGWSDAMWTNAYGQSAPYYQEGWRGNNSEYQDWGLCINLNSGHSYADGVLLSVYCDGQDRKVPVRCFRQL
ncbi:MAG: hypothetical protein LBU42_07570 [Prevotellaceae bacterium]|nr:hypothetical protein [Prevotellaceae bacterium]